MAMFILYGTKGCHLCDEAELLLKQVQSAIAFSWQYVDIALDERLIENYGIRIPVLKKQADQELSWPFSLLDVVRFVS
jgi:hypothetical protein